ncbi:ribosomal protein L7/L12 [Escherichia coli]|uniref:ribosomal protein L7/L12 n=1 Tax=Escherichia coli TaxID=562 RepID=UPI00307A5942
MKTIRFTLKQVGSNKVAAIKQLRDALSIGLKESKDVVDRVGVVGWHRGAHDRRASWSAVRCTEQ